MEEIEIYGRNNIERTGGICDLYLCNGQDNTDRKAVRGENRNESGA